MDNNMEQKILGFKEHSKEVEDLLKRAGFLEAQLKAQLKAQAQLKARVCSRDALLTSKLDRMLRGADGLSSVLDEAASSVEFLTNTCDTFIEEKGLNRLKKLQGKGIYPFCFFDSSARKPVTFSTLEQVCLHLRLNENEQVDVFDGVLNTLDVSSFYAFASALLRQFVTSKSIGKEDATGNEDAAELADQIHTTSTAGLLRYFQNLLRKENELMGKLFQGILQFLSSLKEQGVELDESFGSGVEKLVNKGKLTLGAQFLFMFHIWNTHGKIVTHMQVDVAGIVQRIEEPFSFRIYSAEIITSVKAIGDAKERLNFALKVHCSLLEFLSRRPLVSAEKIIMVYGRRFENSPKEDGFMITSIIG